MISNTSSTHITAKTQLNQSQPQAISTEKLKNSHLSSKQATALVANIISAEPSALLKTVNISQLQSTQTFSLIA
ncbi:hypothetical protein N7931_12580 [Catenovulum sp. 2E275]|uniref:hypothetical protein n=1 Tax=Catenovulum sp. 2E275 TaxID=2980497 RepID=UPI0021CFEE5C|nr:hypothetical protein [Catenovulum sp. 2E275]MCU4676466.1 hypothetical protein [Catenovulum sp. 2E275]